MFCGVVTTALTSQCASVEGPHGPRETVLETILGERSYRIDDPGDTVRGGWRGEGWGVSMGIATSREMRKVRWEAVCAYTMNTVMWLSKV